MDTSTAVAAIDTLGRRIAPRRHRTVEEKVRIVAESRVASVSVAAVARRHGVNANQVFAWRRQQDQGVLGQHSRPRRGGVRLLPVQVGGEPGERCGHSRSAGSAASEGRIEITLAQDVRIAIFGAVPGAPASISVPSSSTTGSYTITWGAASGAVTAYELYESTNSSFSGEVHISNGHGSQGVFPTSMTNALNQTAAKIYDYALGVPLSATDPNGLQVLWQYDGFGRLFRETRPDNTKTTWSYGACTIGNGYCGDNR